MRQLISRLDFHRLRTRRGPLGLVYFHAYVISVLGSTSSDKSGAEAADGSFGARAPG